MTSSPIKPESSHWLRRLFHKLSIRQKILCGYGLALGIAVLGTTGGLVIGDRYYQAARHKMIIADEEGNLFSELQGVLLKIHAHQQELQTVLKQKQTIKPVMGEFNEHLDTAEKLLSQLDEFAKTNKHDNLHLILQKHYRNITDYFQSLRVLSQEISAIHSRPDAQTTGQKLIWEFYQSPKVNSFYEFAHDLTEIAATVEERQELADLEQNRAAILQTQIIVVSMVLSVAIAAILALYISRIIVSPLEEVINTAQQVTEENNFDLQASVISGDEIGKLANSLNQLIHQVKNLLEAQRKEAQSQMIQQEKMSSLGRMLTGVAHEINNPVNFVSGNLMHIRGYVEDLLTLLKTYQAEIPDPPINVQTVVEEIDLEFLESDLPKIFNSMEIGTERTREIVRSLKDFSRLDEEQSQAVDIHACIESTLLILNNRIKHSCKILRNYGKIPFISGYTGLLYQVFMNILSNAVDALEEKQVANPEFQPEITITTEKQEDDWIVVKIADNGTGIALENQSKIFENFFTTKPRGVGTGLGLAISYQIVIEKHHGKLTFTSELNQGTEFSIALPIK
jgi:signal transduction histidine kinase